MNRELKFRAWDENTKQFHYFDLINDSIKKEFTLYEWAKLPVGQYTGYNDIADNEIYEGDIVMIPDYSKGIYITCKQPKKQQVMVWNNGFHGANFKEVEIIGNIYETPELLKDKIQTQI